jgi:DNA-binding LacI/PurR family transcriptional regulator
VLRGVSDVLWYREEHLILTLPKTAKRELEVLRQLAFGHQADGLLIQGCREDDPRVAMLQEAGLPFVALGGEGDEAYHTVTFDTLRFAELLCDRLLERTGAVAVLAVRPRTRETREFFAGCCRTVESRGVPYVEWTPAFVPSRSALREAREQAGFRPLGILLVRQLLPELLAALDEAGLELGTDVWVTYVAGGEEITLVPPGLEIIPLDYYTLGRRAVKLLFQLIDDKDAALSPSRHLVLPGMAEDLLAVQNH